MNVELFKMLRTDIIQQINDADIGPTFAFPYYLIYFPVDSRLSVYRTADQWAVIIETLVFDDHGLGAHDSCQTMFFGYGSNLPQSPGIFYPALNVTGDGLSGGLFESKFDALVSQTATDMMIRGKVVPVTTDPVDYTAAGIELNQSPRILGYELLRLIAPRHRRLFFATEAEIAKRIGESMPLLLRLDEWRHPDRDKGETPADGESFPMIADVIAYNDPSLYRPTVPPNTHWTNWPMAGMI